MSPPWTSATSRNEDTPGTGSAAGRWSGTIDYLKFVACSDLFSEEMEGAAPPPDDGGGCVDLGEIAVDVIGLGDDSVGGYRLRIFAEEGPDTFTVRTVERTTFCSRGAGDDGLCT